MVEKVKRVQGVKPRVLLIGSSGMLGCDLSNELCKYYDIYGADIVISRLPLLTRSFKIDIRDKESVFKIITKTRSDIVVHMAAWTDVDGCERDPKRAYGINRDGTRNIALACKHAGIPLVYISTDFVFDGRKITPYKESDKPVPLSIYADSKLQGEKAVARLLRDYFIIRTSWLYGRCGKNFVDTIIEKAKKEETIKVVSDQAGSPTYTKDLAKAIHVLLDNIFCGVRLQIGIYHISNAGAVSWYDYARVILKEKAPGVKILPISSQELARPAKRPSMSVLDCSKFTRSTGFKMRKWKVALKEYLKIH